MEWLVLTWPERALGMEEALSKKKKQQQTNKTKTTTKTVWWHNLGERLWLVTDMSCGLMKLQLDKMTICKPEITRTHMHTPLQDIVHVCFGARVDGGCYRIDWITKKEHYLKWKRWSNITSNKLKLEQPSQYIGEASKSHNLKKILWKAEM